MHAQAHSEQQLQIDKDLFRRQDIKGLLCIGENIWIARNYKMGVNGTNDRTERGNSIEMDVYDTEEGN